MGTHAECTPAQSPERAGGHQAQGRAGAVRERATWAGRGHAGGERGADVGDVTARGEALPRAPRLARALCARLRRACAAVCSEPHVQPLEPRGAGAPACLPTVSCQAYAPPRNRTACSKRARLARAGPRTHPAPWAAPRAGRARTGTAAASSALRPGPYMPAAPARGALLKRPGAAAAARAGAPGAHAQSGAARRGH